MNFHSRALYGFARHNRSFLASSECLNSLRSYANPAKRWSIQSTALNPYSTRTRNTAFKISSTSTTSQYCPFSSQGKDSPQETEPPEKKLSLYQRFKLMYKEYWYVLLPVHVVTSAGWLGGFYYLAVSGVDIGALLEVSGAPESWVTTVRESKAGGIVTAYTMYKIATPARYTVTLGGTTFSINYLKKLGWIKPIPSREKLKEMYDNQKTVLKDKMTTTKSEIKEEFSKTATEISQHMREAKTGFQQSVSETKHGFKEGVKEATDEWRHVGKLIKSNVKEIIKPQKEGK